MINKLTLPLLAFAACTACNDDNNDTSASPRKTTASKRCLQGHQPQFYGTSTVAGH